MPAPGGSAAEGGYAARGVPAPGCVCVCVCQDPPP